MPDANRSGLGDFLRSRRERLSPEAVGLTTGPRRRARGLRREEVAELAGIGVDWYVRLEQGRAVTPSVATVDALARVLRLDPAEHGHLRVLAGASRRPAFAREQVPDGVRRVVEGLTQPAYVTGRRWDVLAWNSAVADVFTDYGRMPEEDRNILVYLLTDPAARRIFGTAWEEYARGVVEQFRAAHDLWAPDPAFTGLRDRLSRESPEFDGWWQRHGIRGTGSGRKTLHHPGKGVLHFAYTTFQVNEDPGLRLSVYTPL